MLDSRLLCRFGSFGLQSNCFSEVGWFLFCYLFRYSKSFRQYHTLQVFLTSCSSSLDMFIVICNFWKKWSIWYHSDKCGCITFIFISKNAALYSPKSKQTKMLVEKCQLNLENWWKRRHFKEESVSLLKLFILSTRLFLQPMHASRSQLRSNPCCHGDDASCCTNLRIKGEGLTGFPLEL